MEAEAETVMVVIQTVASIVCIAFIVGMTERVIRVIFISALLTIRHPMNVLCVHECR